VAAGADLNDEAGLRVALAESGAVDRRRTQAHVPPISAVDALDRERESGGLFPTRSRRAAEHDHSPPRYCERAFVPGEDVPHAVPREGAVGCASVVSMARA
jgi:hypothetical protein